VSRREFLVRTGGAVSGALVGAVFPGCGRESGNAPSPGKPAAKIGAGAAVRRFVAETATTFPLLEVSGEPFDIGFAIGARFASQIRGAFEGNAAWWADFKRFVDAAPAQLREQFLAAAERHAPDAVAELRGWARGSGVPFDDLLTLNLKCEYGALLDAERAKKEPDASPGCSTLVLNDGKRLLVAHNEDGDKANAPGMFMLRVRPTGKPSFLAASYPGILPGNAPWVNDRGVAVTTNFIYSKSVRPGVGRYFLDRLAVQARSADEALAVSRNPDRAYAYHHVIASAPERRVVSIEVTPEREHVTEIRGLYIHTNHLLAPALSQEAQDLEYVKSSSLTRFEVLTKWKEGHRDLAAIGAGDLVSALSSHEGRPYSPCRHPEGAIRGATLLAVVLDLDRRTVKIFKGQPCLAKATECPFPT
jgi:hypothetical protein